MSGKLGVSSLLKEIQRKETQVGCQRSRAKGVEGMTQCEYVCRSDVVGRWRDREGYEMG